MKLDLDMLNLYLFAAGSHCSIQKNRSDYASRDQEVGQSEMGMLWKVGSL